MAENKIVKVTIKATGEKVEAYRHFERDSYISWPSCKTEYPFSELVLGRDGQPVIQEV